MEHYWCDPTVTKSVYDAPMYVEVKKVLEFWWLNYVCQLISLSFVERFWLFMFMFEDIHQLHADIKTKNGENSFKYK